MGMIFTLITMQFISNDYHMYDRVRKVNHKINAQPEIYILV